MGAGASTPGTSHQDGKADNHAAEPSDYYELLGISVEATSDEIRKAFRKEALKWHPDKNAGSEEAARRFIKIQAAYDVLSDNQERAYYDSHRGDLGDDDDIETASDLRERARQASTAKQSVRISAKQLTRFFDASLWNNDYSDSSESFFGIYQTLFETIAKSEIYATAPAGEPALPAAVQYPAFGNSLSDYDRLESDVRQFYLSFLSFASRRPFNEADKYRLQDAPDRRVRRLMEKENKQARDEARKDYNEAVRSLTAFLKKRDPRFLNSTSSDPIKLKQMEKKKLDEQLRQAARAAAHRREREAQQFVEQDWMKVTSKPDFDEEWSDGEAPSEGEGEEQDVPENEGEGEGSDDAALEDAVEDWYCPACDKLFNSQGAWTNHERSRKHLQNTRNLRKQMLQEEDASLDATSDVEHADSPGNETLDKEIFPMDELDRELRKLSKKDRKRLQRMLNPDDSFEPPAAQLSNTNPTEDHTITSLEAKLVATSQETSELAIGVADGGPNFSVKIDDGSGTIASPSDTPELSKKDKRRAREAAKKAAQNGAPKEDEICRVCNTSFESRTKLFTHLEQTGHASASGNEKGQASRDAKKKGKRR